MRLFILAAALLASTPAFAQDLSFDTAKLCAWQSQNNGMDPNECASLEQEAKASVPALEAAADQPRKDACTTEAQNYSGGSGYASYTVYAECLKNGPGGQ
ncbi:MAG: hypothetical protein LCH46_03685 [Proteobacteria bacterium]|nr:hypothetical protein [Pseudomonadota bacterium]